MTTSSMSEQLDIGFLGRRAALACATVGLCGVHLDLHRRCWEADERGTPVDIHARVQLVKEHYDDEVRAFAGAWERGRSFQENLRVTEVATRGFASSLKADEPTRSGIERWLLDFIRGYACSVTGRLLESKLWEIDRLFTCPQLVRVRTALGVLLKFCGEQEPNPTGLGASVAAQSVKTTITETLADGFDPDCMQALLDSWATATGGPHIVLSIDKPSTPPSSQASTR